MSLKQIVGYYINEKYIKIETNCFFLKIIVMIIENYEKNLLMIFILLNSLEIKKLIRRKYNSFDII